MSKTAKKCSAEIRSRGARMVLDHEGEHSSQWAAVSSMAAEIGCSAQTLKRLRAGWFTDASGQYF